MQKDCSSFVSLPHVNTREIIQTRSKWGLQFKLNQLIRDLQVIPGKLLHRISFQGNLSIGVQLYWGNGSERRVLLGDAGIGTITLVYEKWITSFVSRKSQYGAYFFCFPLLLLLLWGLEHHLYCCIKDSLHILQVNEETQSKDSLSVSVLGNLQYTHTCCVFALHSMYEVVPISFCNSIPWNRKGVIYWS